MVSAVLGISKHELPVRLGDVFDFFSCWAQEP